MNNSCTNINHKSNNSQQDLNKLLAEYNIYILQPIEEQSTIDKYKVIIDQHRNFIHSLYMYKMKYNKKILTEQERIKINELLKSLNQRSAVAKYLMLKFLYPQKYILPLNEEILSFDSNFQPNIIKYQQLWNQETLKYNKKLTYYSHDIQLTNAPYIVNDVICTLLNLRDEDKYINTHPICNMIFYRNAIKVILKFTIALLIAYLMQYFICEYLVTHISIAVFNQAIFNTILNQFINICIQLLTAVCVNKVNKTFLGVTTVNFNSISPFNQFNIYNENNILQQKRFHDIENSKVLPKSSKNQELFNSYCKMLGIDKQLITNTTTFTLDDIKQKISNLNLVENDDLLTQGIQLQKISLFYGMILHDKNFYAQSLKDPGTAEEINNCIYEKVKFFVHKMKTIFTDKYNNYTSNDITFAYKNIDQVYPEPKKINLQEFYRMKYFEYTYAQKPLDHKLSPSYFNSNFLIENSFNIGNPKIEYTNDKNTNIKKIALWFLNLIKVSLLFAIIFFIHDNPLQIKDITWKKIVKPILLFVISIFTLDFESNINNNPYDYLNRLNKNIDHNPAENNTNTAIFAEHQKIWALISKRDKDKMPVRSQYH